MTAGNMSKRHKFNFGYGCTGDRFGVRWAPVGFVLGLTDPADDNSISEQGPARIRGANR